MARGSNQSIDTKFATSLICDAVSLINSGRIDGARRALNRALSLLPDIDDDVQIDAVLEYLETRKPFNA